MCTAINNQFSIFHPKVHFIRAVTDAPTGSNREGPKIFGWWRIGFDDIVEFLASLTSPDYRELGQKELARQRALSRTKRSQRDTTRAFGPKPPRPNPPRP